MDLSQELTKSVNREDEYKNKAKIFDGLDQYSGEDRVMEFSDVAAEVEESTKGNEKIVSRISPLDEMVGGFRAGQLIVLSAPTGQGKTAFLQSLTRTLSEDKIPSLWFSYEVSPSELRERFEDDIPKFYLPRKNKESSLEWMKTRALEGIAKFGTKVIFIDHLHYLLSMQELAQARSVSLLIGMLMRELKKFALETEITIFLVSHLTKTKLEALPTIDDLRDSSFVGQEADIVMIMWRHREADKSNELGFRYTNESRLVVAKNRINGKLGYIKLKFEKGRFKEDKGLLDPDWGKIL